MDLNAASEVVCVFVHGENIIKIGFIKYSARPS